MDLVRATRTAVERRSVLPPYGGAGMSISDFDGVLDMIAGGGAPTYTGKLVSPRNALSISFVWSCVDVLAGDWATLPVEPYRWIDPDISRERARDHYLWPLFRESANPRMSSWFWKYVMETWRQLWGNSYAVIDENGRGQVQALWPLRPDRVKVWLEDPNDITSRVWYAYIPLDRSKKPLVFASESILHLKDMSMDGIVGLSKIEVHRNTYGLSMAMQEHSGRFYGQGAMVKSVFKHPAKLGIKGEQNMLNMLKKYEGLANSWKTMILEEGMDFKEVGMPMKDAQYIESLNANGADIARIFGVPQHRVGLMDRQTNNNIEFEGMEYVQYRLGVNASNWISECHHSLLSANEREKIFLLPDFKYLLAADHEARGKYYQSLAAAGALAPDDIRHDEGRNPLPGGIGKKPRVGVNTVPLGSELASGNRATPPPQTPKVEEEGTAALPGEEPKRPNGLAH